ncbi:MAG TPA: hypothetical protein V6D08_07085 [Candidatus Obscuribacterales bacterium]
MPASELSFHESLRASEELLSRFDNGQLGKAAFAGEAAAILSSVSGARGFLVTLLTGEFRAADEPAEELVEALRGAGAVVCDLLAKNLVMSSAMAVAHERELNYEAAAGSKRVFARTARLVQSLEIDEMRARLEAMWLALTQGSGEYSPFLKRWQYDEEQLEQVRTAMRAFV